MSGSIGCLDWLCLHIITYHTCLILFQYVYKDNCFKFMWVLLLVSNKEIKNGIINTFLAFNSCFTKSKSAPAQCLSPKCVYFRHQIISWHFATEENPQISFTHKMMPQSKWTWQTVWHGDIGWTWGKSHCFVSSSAAAASGASASASPICERKNAVCAQYPV